MYIIYIYITCSTIYIYYEPYSCRTCSLICLDSQSPSWSIGWLPVYLWKVLDGSKKVCWLNIYIYIIYIHTLYTLYIYILYKIHKYNQLNVIWVWKCGNFLTQNPMGFPWFFLTNFFPARGRGGRRARPRRFECRPWHVSLFNGRGLEGSYTWRILPLA